MPAVLGQYHVDGTRCHQEKGTLLSVVQRLSVVGARLKLLAERKSASDRSLLPEWREGAQLQGSSQTGWAITDQAP